MARLRLVALPLIALLLSCAAPDGQAERAAASAPEPYPTDAAKPWDARGVHLWIAGCNVGEDLWKFRHHSTTVWCDPLGRELVGSEGRFDWPVYLEAGQIDSLVLTGDGLGEVSWRFWWSDDELFDTDRSLVGQEAVGEGVRLLLSANPAWRSTDGPLYRLRLSWKSEPPAEARLLTARGE